MLLKKANYSKKIEFLDVKFFFLSHCLQNSIILLYGIMVFAITALFQISLLRQLIQHKLWLHTVTSLSFTKEKSSSAALNLNLLTNHGVAQLVIWVHIMNGLTANMVREL